MLRDVAFVGLGLAVVTTNAAKEAFNALSRRGETVRRGDGTVAARLDRTVMHDAPAAVGHALGVAVDGAVRGVEAAVHLGHEIPAVMTRGIEAALERLGVPSAGEIARVRARLDAVAAKIDRLERLAPATPPWEEAPDGDPEQGEPGRDR